MVFHLPGVDASVEDLRASFATEVGEPLGLDFQITLASTPKRLAIMVSRHDHCLLDLLWRWRRRELYVDLALVISNHPDPRSRQGADAAPEHAARTPETKSAAEEGQRTAAPPTLGARAHADPPPLPDLRWDAPVDWDIHHSFLPAFVGPSPYEQARARGVKLIGATAHYVTEHLDAGPIIEQDVIRVRHDETTPADARRGRGSDIDKVPACAAGGQGRGPASWPR